MSLKYIESIYNEYRIAKGIKWSMLCYKTDLKTQLLMYNLFDNSS